MAIFSGETLGALLTLLGFDGTEFRNIKVDADGHIQVDALALALPSGAATAAHQVTMITALQLIDDLRAALNDVGTDELRVLAGLFNSTWKALDVDTDGHVQVDVLSGGGGTSDATAANQTTMITALQLIDDLRAALNDVGTDELRVLVGLFNSTWKGLTVDTDGHVQVDVLSGGGGTSDATAANQTTMITALQLIDDLRAALNDVGTDELRVLVGLFNSTWKGLTVDTDGHVQVDVLSGGGGTSDATAAKQDTMITFLQLIDDLRGALHSVSTDSLLVRAEDQLQSFKAKLLDATENADTGAGAIGLAGSSVPAGEVWVITSVLAINTVSVCDAIYLFVIDGSDEAAFRRGDNPSITAGLSWSGHIYLEAGDRVNATFLDCTLHDAVYLQSLGYKMLKATNGGPPPPGEQDFTTFIEVDSGNTITVTENRITIDEIDANGPDYVYKDFGVDYFDALHIQFTIRVNEPLVSSMGAGVGLANVIDDHYGFGNTDFTSVIWKTTAGPVRLQLRRGYAEAEDYYVATVGDWYYCILLRAAGGDTITLKIYSDAARTVLVDTLTVSGFGTEKWRYLYGFVGMDLGQTAPTWDGYIDDLSIG